MSKFYKYRPPNLLLSKSGGGGINYFNWNFEILQTLKLNFANLKKILTFFDNYQDFEYLPISVTYSKIVPKTSRITNILRHNNHNPQQISAEYIYNQKEELKNVRVVYSCAKSDIERSLTSINEVIQFLENNENLESQIRQIVSNPELNHKKINESLKDFLSLKYQNFRNKDQLIISDFCFIEKIEIKIWNHFTQAPIFAFLPLKSNDEIKAMLKIKGIELDYNSFIAGEFWNLDLMTVNQIVDEFPFLFSSAAKDEELEIDRYLNNENFLKVPSNLIEDDFSQQIIGLIDSEVSLPEQWAKKALVLGENLLEIHQEPDQEHGTQVASLLIANDLLNQRKDGLGLFKVKPFNVLPQGKILTSQLMRKIEDVIKRNYQKIKVWNLSVGCEKDGNKISIFGQLIDSLQYKYHVLFIISAGNKGNNKLISPADSLTSISVGSAYKNQNGVIQKCDYSGSAKIFGLFNKPSTYELGNNLTEEEWDRVPLNTLTSKGKPKIENGTSFAAPLVARKAAFLMEKLNLSDLTTRAVLNYLSQINSNHISDLSILFEDNSDIFVFIEGELKAGTKCEIPVVLPHIENKISFAASFSLAYNISNKLDMGDEYSSTDITFRLANKWGEQRGNILSSKKEKWDGLNANEGELRKFFDKYNPNTILIDEDFKLNKSKNVPHLNEFSFVLDRTDLVDGNSEEIRYGLVIHFKEIKEGSLQNFLTENLENIIEVLEIEQKEKIEIEQDENIEIEVS